MELIQSRLSNYKRRQALKTAFLYFVLTFTIIIFISKFGTAAVTILTSLVGKDTANTESKNNPLSPPQFDILPTITNKDSLLVTGKAEPSVSLRLTLNGQKQDILVNSQGNWNFEFKLHDGINTFRAQVVDKSGNTSREISSNVTLDATPPKLEISGPEDGTNKVGKKEQFVTVSGITESDVFVKINERIAILNGSGEFSTTMPLNEGENIFTISATDKAGNEVSETRKVIFSI